jgi:glycine/D-amino acid oxidase-like deaminating enzyme
MVERLEALLGRSLPPVVRRWDGVYQQSSDDRIWYRELVDEGVLVLTGAGGRGLTLAPAIAEDTFSWFEEGRESGGSHPGALRPPGAG